MTAPPLYRPGSWCDVAVWIDGRLIQVTADGALVRCYLENVPVWQQQAPEALLYCRGAVQGNLMLTVHQGQSGSFWLVGNGLTRNLGPTFGVQPVGIDSAFAYVVSGQPRGTYDRFGLVDQTFPFPPGVPLDTSQGLSDVQPDGTLWFADVHRTMAINGVTFTYPNVRGISTSPGVFFSTVTVGQVEGGIMAAVGGKNTLVIPGAECYEPHVAVSPNGRVAICARTPQGAAYVATTIQELSA